MGQSASATVLGGFFAQYSGTLTPISSRGAARTKAAQALAKEGNLELRERMHELNGVAPGATALATRTRVAASSELGGVRAIETETLINRATTAADVTEIDATVLTYSSTTTFGASPPANLDGNPLGTR